MGGSTYLHIYGFNRPVLDLCGGVGGTGDKLVGWLGLVGEVVSRRPFLAVFVFGLQTYYITTFFFLCLMVWMVCSPAVCSVKSLILSWGGMACTELVDIDETGVVDGGWT